MRAVACAVLVLAAGPAAAQPGPEDAAEAALRATVRVMNGAVAGTAWFVAVPGEPPRTLLVTAGHVLNDMKTPDCKVVFRAAGKGGEFVRKEVPVPIRDGDAPRWTVHREHDVAVLPLAVPAGVDVEPIPLARVADATWTAQRKIRAGQDVFVPCFPLDNEANPAGWPVLRKGTIATHPLAPNVPTMFVDYATFRGDSGAPVVAYPDGRPLVVGLVFAGRINFTTTTGPFEERRSFMPLHLAVAAQGPVIRQAIDRALRRE